MAIHSIKEAIAFGKEHMPDAFLAVGGGSVIDTAKLMNLYVCNPGMRLKPCNQLGTVTHSFQTLIFLTMSTHLSVEACPSKAAFIR